METSRDDVSIAIRSAFFAKGTKQKFSLLALVVLSVLLGDWRLYPAPVGGKF